MYQQTKMAVEELGARVDRMELRGGNKERSLNNPKHIIPEKLNSGDMWKTRKSDVEDFCEESMEGMKEILDEVKDHDDEIGDEDLSGAAVIWWTRRAMLWRFLKKHTEGEAKKVVQGCRGNNGCEAWRKLHQQFEPGMVMREALVMSTYTGMVAKRARNP